MLYSEVLRELKRLADPAVVKGLSRYGIPSQGALGITAPKLRALGRRIGRDQPLSLRLYESGILEARGLAALVGNPAEVTRRQMQSWARRFDSWAVCDGCCCTLFVFSPSALEMAFKWVESDKEFVKRAGFVLMAAAAVHLKELPDRAFVPMLNAIVRGSVDERNFVRKAVNWALRQIGKRNLRLNATAIRAAVSVSRKESRAARWVAADALRELRSEPVQRRLSVDAHRIPRKRRGA